MKPQHKKKGNKAVIVILDGLGDRTMTILGGRTPLEAAETRYMNHFASSGMCGLVSHWVPWVPVGTQIGAGLLLGLARADVNDMQRGPVEAAGADMPIENGDLALRCNFATLGPTDSGFVILDRRAGRIDRGTDMLAESLDGIELEPGIRCRFSASTQHRSVVLLQGAGLSDAISDTDPGAGNKSDGLLWSRPHDPSDENAARSAALVNKFIAQSYRTLENHPVNRSRIAAGLPPANGLLTRGAGQRKPLRNLISHLGLKAAVISGEGTMLGLARLFNFTVIHRPSFTATVKTDIEGKVSATLDALEDHDIAFLHLKGTDVCAHDKDPQAKRRFIEKIDRELAPLTQRDLVIGITGDHSTDSSTGRHCGDPVPALISGPNCRRDPVTKFGEINCIGGGLGNLNATSFLAAILDLMGNLHNYRSRDRYFFCEQ